MFPLRRVQAANTPMQMRPLGIRPLGDPLLDPRTAAYLEPATLPVSRRNTGNSASRSRIRWLYSLREIAQRPYPRLWAGFLFLLIMLLYLLVYAQESGGAAAPYLVVSPPDSHSVRFLVQPDGSVEPELPMPVTGW